MTNLLFFCQFNWAQFSDGFIVASFEKAQRVEIQSTDTKTPSKPIAGTFVSLNGVSVYDGPENEAHTDISYSFGDPVRAKRVKRA